jgi:hypothetical protein
MLSVVAGSADLPVVTTAAERFGSIFAAVDGVCENAAVDRNMTVVRKIDKLRVRFTTKFLLDLLQTKGTSPHAKE